MRILSAAVSNVARKLVLADKYGPVKVYATLVRNTASLSKAGEALSCSRMPLLAARCGSSNMVVVPVRAFRVGNGALFAEAAKKPSSGGSKSGSGSKSSSGGWSAKDFLILGSGVGFVVLLTAPICGLDYNTPDHTGHVTPSFSFMQFAFLMFTWLAICVAIERGMHHQRFITKQLKRGLDQAGKTGGFSLKL